MSLLKLLFREIGFRKTHFLLSLVAVTVAAALFVTAPVLIEGYGREANDEIARLRSETDATLARMEDETRKIMKNMGFNLMIVHRDTNMSEFWAEDFAAKDMPQDYVQRLAAAEELTLVTHLVATLQKKLKWEGRSVLLVGYMPEATQTHRQKKAPMGYVIERGTAYLGFELGAGRQVGETINVLGRELRIAKILGEQGSKEDITIAVSLEDAQAMLDRAGLVNQIMALGCHCAGERLPKVRKQLEAVLPETRITEFRSQALARAEERDLVAAQREAVIASMTESANDVKNTLDVLAAVTVPLVVLACAVWLGLLALGNVRERKAEIGLMRALGVRSSRILTLFLGKAVTLGVLGGALGFVAGALLARVLGVHAFDADSSYFTARLDLLAFTLVGAPLVSAMASYLPALVAATQDPALVLRDE